MAPRSLDLCDILAGMAASRLPVPAQAEPSLPALRTSVGDEVGVLTPWLASLYFPYQAPKDPTAEWTRRAGPYHVTVTPQAATGGLPFGILPRQVTPTILSLAVRTANPVIELPTLSELLTLMGLATNSGGINSPRGRLRTQLPRILFAHFLINDVTNPERDRMRSIVIGDEMDIWWAKAAGRPGRPAKGRRDAWLRLNQGFFEELMASQVHLHLPTIRKLSPDKNAMKLDTYVFAASQAPQIDGKHDYEWEDLFERFGNQISDDPVRYGKALSSFKKDFRDHLAEVRQEYKALRADASSDEGLTIWRSDPHVDPSKLVIPNVFPGSQPTKAQRLPISAAGKPVQGELIGKDFTPLQPTATASGNDAGAQRSTPTKSAAPSLIQTPSQHRRVR